MHPIPPRSGGGIRRGYWVSYLGIQEHKIPGVLVHIIRRSIIAVIASNMLFKTIIGVALLGFANALPSPHLQSRQSGWPNAPFTTKGRDIVNSQGDVITYAGVNWPGVR